MLTLHDYQINAHHFIKLRKHVYMMLDMGLGKTAIALSIMAVVPRPTIVLGTLRICYDVWPEEIQKWQPQLKHTILHGPDKHIRIKLKRDVYLLNYDGIPWFYKQCVEKNFAWSQKHILVIDESTFIKDPSTKRFNLLKKMDALFGPYRMCLSGIPSPNGLHELWPQYYMLDHGERLGAKVSHYRARYFDQTGPPRFKYVPKEHSQKHIYKKIEDITIRLDANDHNKLPEVIYNAIRLTLPERLKKAYKKIEAEGKSPDDIDDLNHSAVLNNLRQFAQGGLYDKGGPKYDKVHELKLVALKELVDTAAGKPILCAIHYKFELDMIQTYFKGPIPHITGKTNARIASQYIKKWVRGDIPLLLVHPRSVGHGVNMQAGGHIVVWYNLPWSLEAYRQLNARLVRQGQTALTVILHHLVVNGTIDEAVIKVLASKEAIQQDLFSAIKGYMEERNGSSLD